MCLTKVGGTRREYLKSRLGGLRQVEFEEKSSAEIGKEWTLGCVRMPAPHTHSGSVRVSEGVYR